MLMLLGKMAMSYGFQKKDPAVFEEDDTKFDYFYVYTRNVAEEIKI